MYEHVGGFIECCCCKFAPLVKTIYTEGTEKLSENDLSRRLFGIILPCEHCGGKGCNKCMMHGNIELSTYQDALDHLKEHVKSGDYVPNYALEALTDDIQSGRKF